MKFSCVRKQLLKVFIHRLYVSHSNSKGKLAILSAVLLLLLLTGFAFLVERPVWFHVAAIPCNCVYKSFKLVFLREMDFNVSAEQNE